MEKNIIKSIQKNENLMLFCHRILSYNAIFENETARSMFFVSLVSSDCLTDEHQCDETIETASFILNHIDLFILDDTLKKSVIKYCKDAIKIAKRDKKNFNKDLINDHLYHCGICDEEFEELTDYPYIGIGSKPHNVNAPTEEQLERIIGG